jgi:hypothetical protein
MPKIETYQEAAERLASEEEAHQAYCQAAQAVDGEFFRAG